MEQERIKALIDPISRVIQYAHFSGERDTLDRNVEERLREAMKRIVNREERGLSDLYDVTRARVYGLALFMSRDADLADDATVGVYTQVWHQGSRFDHDKGSILNWLLMLTRSRTLDLIRIRSRNQQRETTLEEAMQLCQPIEESPEAANISNDQAARVRQALSELPCEQRELLLAGFYVGMTHNELADQYDLPLGTVKSRIRLGLRGLKRALNHEERQWL